MEVKGGHEWRVGNPKNCKPTLGQCLALVPMDGLNILEGRQNEHPLFLSEYSFLGGRLLGNFLLILKNSNSTLEYYGIFRSHALHGSGAMDANSSVHGFGIVLPNEGLFMGALACTFVGYFESQS